MTERNARFELVVLLFVHGSSKMPPTKAQARRALLPLLIHLGATEAERRIDTAFDACAELGELEASGGPKSPRYSLAQLGAHRLDAEFGKLANVQWRKLRQQYLVPHAAAGRSKAPGLKSYPALRAYLALRSNGIEYRARQTDTAVLNRIVAKALGAARAERGAIEISVIRSWLGTDTTSTARAAETAENAGTAARFDLEAFARHVNEAARQSPTGRWSTAKVFVNHVWRQFQWLGHGEDVDAADFKHRLLEANQRGLVRLSRADLVISMPRDDVRDSEIATLGGDVFHFVNI